MFKKISQEELLERQEHAFKVLNNLKIQERLQILIEEYNLTQHEFAQYIGSTRITVSKWLNGQDGMKISTLIQISIIFNVSIYWLLGLTNIKNPDIMTQKEFSTKEFVDKIQKSDLIPLFEYIRNISQEVIARPNKERGENIDN